MDDKIMITHRGGCHCGRVRFEVDAPAELYIDECNCSMSARTAYLHLIVTADRFRIKHGREALTLYTTSVRSAAPSLSTYRVRIPMA